MTAQGGLQKVSTDLRGEDENNPETMIREYYGNFQGKTLHHEKERGTDMGLEEMCQKTCGVRVGRKLGASGRVMAE